MDFTAIQPLQRIAKERYLKLRDWHRNTLEVFTKHLTAKERTDLKNCFKAKLVMKGAMQPHLGAVMSMSTETAIFVTNVHQLLKRSPRVPHRMIVNRFIRIDSTDQVLTSNAQAWPPSEGFVLPHVLPMATTLREAFAMKWTFRYNEVSDDQPTAPCCMLRIKVHAGANAFFWGPPPSPDAKDISRMAKELFEKYQLEYEVLLPPHTLRITKVGVRNICTGILPEYADDIQIDHVQKKWCKIPVYDCELEPIELVCVMCASKDVAQQLCGPKKAVIGSNLLLSPTHADADLMKRIHAAVKSGDAAWIPISSGKEVTEHLKLHNPSVKWSDIQLYIKHLPKLLAWLNRYTSNEFDLDVYAQSIEKRNIGYVRNLITTLVDEFDNNLFISWGIQKVAAADQDSRLSNLLREGIALLSKPGTTHDKDREEAAHTWMTVLQQVLHDMPTEVMANDQAIDILFEAADEILENEGKTRNQRRIIWALKALISRAEFIERGLAAHMHRVRLEELHDVLQHNTKPMRAKSCGSSRSGSSNVSSASASVASSSSSSPFSSRWSQSSLASLSTLSSLASASASPSAPASLHSSPASRKLVQKREPSTSTSSSSSRSSPKAADPTSVTSITSERDVHKYQQTFVRAIGPYIDTILRQHPSLHMAGISWVPYDVDAGTIVLGKERAGIYRNQYNFFGGKLDDKLEKIAKIAKAAAAGTTATSRGTEIASVLFEEMYEEVGLVLTPDAFKASIITHHVQPFGNKSEASLMFVCATKNLTPFWWNAIMNARSQSECAWRFQEMSAVAVMNTAGRQILLPNISAYVVSCIPFLKTLKSKVGHVVGAIKPLDIKTMQTARVQSKDQVIVVSPIDKKI